MSQGRFLGYGRQLIDDDDVAAVEAVLKGDFLTQGPAVQLFEEALAKKVGARHAVAVANGSAALHVACLAAGVGSRSVALVPDVTFVATANAVAACGGRIVVADIDREIIGLDSQTVAAALDRQPEISALLPVHMAGLAGDMAALREIAGDRLVIEDAAHALGGSYPDGAPVGSCAHSDLTCFSFHPVKPITAGEGGAVTTNDAELARRLRLFRSHGIERDPAYFETESAEIGPWLYEQQQLGYNYRLSDIHAALAYSQLSKLDGFVARRRTIAERYDRVFKETPRVRPLQSTDSQRKRSAHHLYVVEIDFPMLGKTRGRLMEELKQEGVGSQVHYIPLSRQPFYQRLLDIEPATFPEAESYYAGCLSLPLHPGLTDHDVERVIYSMQQALEKAPPRAAGQSG